MRIKDGGDGNTGDAEDDGNDGDRPAVPEQDDGAHRKDNCKLKKRADTKAREDAKGLWRITAQDSQIVPNPLLPLCFGGQALDVGENSFRRYISSSSELEPWRKQGLHSRLKNGDKSTFFCTCSP